jgi:hypothetical protein
MKEFFQFVVFSELIKIPFKYKKPNLKTNSTRILVFDLGLTTDKLQSVLTI